MEELAVVCQLVDGTVESVVEVVEFFDDSNDEDTCVEVGELHVVVEEPQVEDEDVEIVDEIDERECVEEVDTVEGVDTIEEVEFDV